jgi:hypothetical protein
MVAQLRYEADRPVAGVLERDAQFTVKVQFYIDQQEEFKRTHS